MRVFKCIYWRRTREICHVEKRGTFHDARRDRQSEDDAAYTDVPSLERD